MSAPRRLARRDFLAATAAGLGGAVAGSFARSGAARERDASDRHLVLIELAGGNDGWNTVVPVDDDVYHRVRGRLAVPAADAVPLAPGVGFHPALRRLGDRFQRGEVAVVGGAGGKDAGRSHEAACAATLPRGIGPSVGGQDLVASLGVVAERIARPDGPRVHRVRLPGFDTHAHQRHRHARLLARLDVALDAFFGHLESSGASDRTLVVCQSEFGRRLVPNKTGGTDHGASGPLLVLGAAARIRGGLHGARPASGDVDRDGGLPVTVDLRDVHGALADRWLRGLPARAPAPFLA